MRVLIHRDVENYISMPTKHVFRNLNYHLISFFIRNATSDFFKKYMTP